MKYSIEQLKARFAELGFKWDSTHIHLIGIRKLEGTPDRFDDLMYLVWGNSLYVFTCTTEPGVHWLQKLMNKAGTAIVKSNEQYLNVYRRGLHKGKPALVQHGPLKVYRDADMDRFAETFGEPVKAGPECKINIHGTGPSVVSVVIGAWSAGCQVLNNPEEYRQFMELVNKSSQELFTYTLLSEF